MSSRRSTGSSDDLNDRPALGGMETGAWAGGAAIPRPCRSDVDLLGAFDGVVDLVAEIENGIFDLRMPEWKLHRTGAIRL